MKNLVLATVLMFGAAAFADEGAGTPPPAAPETAKPAAPAPDKAEKAVKPAAKKGHGGKKKKAE